MPALQLAPLTLLLLVLFFAPLAVLFVYSFWKLDGFSIVSDWTIANYVSSWTEMFHVRLLLRSLAIGATVAALSVALAYPFAYAATFRFARFRNALIFAVLISMFASYLVRVYAFQSILGEQGVINWLLRRIGLIDDPLSFLLFNKFAVIVTLTNVFIPYVVLPIWASMQNVDRSTLEAARDLGARPASVFRKIVLPATAPGALAGFAFAFVLAAGDYVTPTLVGGANGLMIGKVIANAFGLTSDYPLGSALAFTLLVWFAGTIALGLLARRLYRRARARSSGRGARLPRLGAVRIPGASLWAHVYVPLLLGFLFAPLLIVVVLSFTTRTVPAFPLTDVTLDWYRNVFSDDIFRSALTNSVVVAAVTALAAAALGTLAALALSRRRSRFSRALTGGLVVPLALPGLITGIAMLTFWVRLGVGLSTTTIALGHIVFVAPFVLLVMVARLRDLDPSLEEAGRDLGEGPWGVFRRVTFPLILPAVAGGALVAAALSLDEFIITNFVSGSTVTLPLFIWSKLRIGVTPDVNAVSTLVLLGLCLLVVASYSVLWRSRVRASRFAGSTKGELG